MKKNNPEDKNKIRRKSVSSNKKNSKTTSSRRVLNDEDDFLLPSERRRLESEKEKSSSSRKISSNPRRSSSESKTRSVSSSASSRNKSNKKKSSYRSVRRKSRNKKKKKIVGGLIAFFIICFAIGLGFVFASLKDVKPVDEALLDKLTHQTTTIKYSNGETMSTAPTLYKKTPVPLSDMSPYLRKAIVSIEDERFYSHNGVDYWGLLRSTVKTLVGKKQGGSTLPMQISKVLLTSRDQTLSRKIKDIYYALEMSKSVSKEKLLETYLNNYFVGRGMVGAEAGARGYFDKQAKDLSLAQSAMLAGITKNPSKYSLYKTARLEGKEKKSDLDHKLLFYLSSEGFEPADKEEKEMYEKLLEWNLIDSDTYKQLKSGELVVRKAVNNPEAKFRQLVVLNKMKELNAISEKEYVNAKNEKIVIKLPDSKERIASSVESLIEYDVIDSLMELGKTEEEARNMYYNGGLIINTTIDPKIQNAIEAEYEKNNNFPNNKIASNGLSQPQSATVIIDYKTGGIKGLIGGRNIKARKTLNRATTPYQPGSTIKPLTVYTPAIDTLKVNQSTLMSDTRGGYRFKENREDNPETTTSGTGSMSLRHGLALSSNTIAYKTAELLGPTYNDCIDVMMDYLRNFGVTSVLDFKEENKAGFKRSDRHFNSLVLGGLTRGISPLQMASAFGTLANGGIYVEPEVFTTITSYNGELIVKNTPKTHKVVDPAVAYVITDMLSAVVKEGIGKNAALSSGIPVAGKTGSTNNYLDTWFVGYTPYYSGATYIGDDAGIKNDDGSVMKRRRIEGGGSMSSSKLWAKIMNRVHKNLEYKKFDKPEKIDMISINPVDGGKTSYGALAAFVEGTSPDRYSYSYVRRSPTTRNNYNRGNNTNTNTNTNTNPNANTNPNTNTNSYNRNTTNGANNGAANTRYGNSTGYNRNYNTNGARQNTGAVRRTQ